MTNNPEIISAVRYIEQGQVGKAEELCKRILSACPLHADALHYLGVAALYQGQPARAIKLIEQAITLDSDWNNFHNNHPVAGPSEKPTAAAATSVAKGSHVCERLKKFSFSNSGI